MVLNAAFNDAVTKSSPQATPEQQKIRVSPHLLKSFHQGPVCSTIPILMLCGADDVAAENLTLIAFYPVNADIIQF